MDIVSLIDSVTSDARSASRSIAAASTKVKNEVLFRIADQIDRSRNDILKANEHDLESASGQISEPLLDRLGVSNGSIDRICTSTRAVAELPDPVGITTDLMYRPSGIQVGKRRVPIGVIGIIYESRPNVTVEAASLCLKSGNACILRGGSEAIHTNRALADCIESAFDGTPLPPHTVQVLPITDRAAVGELLKRNDRIDVIVPRGGKSLIERITRESSIPVIKHLDGVCHVYIERSADLEMSVRVTVNSKSEKYGVCNAAETLLLDEEIASKVLPTLAERFDQLGVELRACDRSRQFVPSAVPATEEDWTEEYLAPVLAIRVVDGIEAAIDHINRFGSGHTDTIISNDYTSTQRFLREVDSATVMVNASTQFADGFEFGLGAEVGISTDKLHARGPVGLEGLTTEKFVVLGNGEIRQR